MASVRVQGHAIKALINSGAAQTIISPRVVEKYDIPYQNKKYPLKVVSAEETPIGYKKGTIRLKIDLVTLEVSNTNSQINISIINLGELDMLIGYN